MKRIAFITGITGQDGSYLAELLLEKGYEVHGLFRRVALENQNDRLSRIKHLLEKITLHHGDITDVRRMYQIIKLVQPDEVYHLAAQSHVAVSFEDVSGSMDSILNGTMILLEVISSLVPGCRVYNAATSEMFGRVLSSPQNENTPFNPVSPYGIAKEAAYRIARLYREKGLFVSSGILFNHESPRRGVDFVTRKITRQIARMSLTAHLVQQGRASNTDHILVLGNLLAERDWGFAGDYVYAMWLMLQHNVPDDFVVATGEKRTVKAFIDEALHYIGFSKDKIEFLDFSHLSLSDADCAVGRLSQKNKFFIVQHPRWYRPAEVDTLCGDSSHAYHELGWKPTVTFNNLVGIMMHHDFTTTRVYA